MINRKEFQTQMLDHQYDLLRLFGTKILSTTYDLTTWLHHLRELGEIPFLIETYTLNDCFVVHHHFGYQREIKEFVSPESVIRYYKTVGQDLSAEQCSILRGIAPQGKVVKFDREN